MKFFVLVATLLVAAQAASLKEGKADIDSILFYSYTRANPTEPIQVFVDNLNGALIDPTKPTKFVTHGFTDNVFSGWIERAKDAFLAVEDCNFISIDWSDIGFYFNVDRAGTYVGKFYDYLATQGFNTEDFYCSGHSLGAHVCGFSGKTVTAGKVGRISGLDASLPDFDVEDPTRRLAIGDAIVVDLLHTNGNASGHLAPLGNADFYPNGGMSQPGCGLDIQGICSHTRVRDLFIESIQTTGFKSFQCGSWEEFETGICATNPTAPMGASMPLDTVGIYYLHTNRDSPYAIN